ncbi:MAG: hypothetical protein ABGZ24_06505, partial [Fuerstiella sp.]
FSLAASLATHGSTLEVNLSNVANIRGNLPLMCRTNLRPAHLFASACDSADFGMMFLQNFDDDLYLSQYWPVLHLIVQGVSNDCDLIL